MNKKTVIYSLCCGIGGGLIGSFAGKLNTTYGACMFTLGVVLLVFFLGRIKNSR